MSRENQEQPWPKTEGAAEAAFESALTGALARAPEVRAAPDFAPRVGRAAASQAVPASGRPRPGWATGASAAAAILLLLLMLQLAAREPGPVLGLVQIIYAVEFLALILGLIFGPARSWRFLV